MLYLLWNLQRIMWNHWKKRYYGETWTINLEFNKNCKRYLFQYCVGASHQIKIKAFKSNNKKNQKSRRSEPEIIWIRKLSFRNKKSFEKIKINEINENFKLSRFYSKLLKPSKWNWRNFQRFCYQSNKQNEIKFMYFCFKWTWRKCWYAPRNGKIIF